jgi:hypothetical protein
MFLSFRYKIETFMIFGIRSKYLVLLKHRSFSLSSFPQRDKSDEVKLKRRSLIKSFYRFESGLWRLSLVFGFIGFLLYIPYGSKLLKKYIGTKRELRALEREEEEVNEEEN